MKTNMYINQLIPYSSKQAQTSIRLNANETANYLFPKGILLDVQFERYPVSTPIQLAQAIATKYAVSNDSVLLGNGSTELLELTVKTFTEPGDTIISLDPSFAMYKIYSDMYGCNLQTVSVTQTTEALFEQLSILDQQCKPALVFLCNPNNPTGSLLPKKAILNFIKASDALVVVDEAYMEFASEKESLTDETSNYPNLLIARTFSKAYGLASMRLGYMIGSSSTIQTLSKAKLPYSLNEATAQIGLLAIRQTSTVSRFVQSVISERERLFVALTKLGINVRPSFTNFLYVTSDIDLQAVLLDYDILIRSFRNGSYRITIGTREENNSLLQALQEVLS